MTVRLCGHAPGARAMGAQLMILMCRHLYGGMTRIWSGEIMSMQRGTYNNRPIAGLMRKPSRAILTAVAAAAAMAGMGSLRATTVYWTGDENASWAQTSGHKTNWSSSSNTNIDIDRLVGSGDDIVFYMAGATNLSTALNQSFTINSLSMTSSSTSSVTIATGSGTNTLTINGGGITLYSGAGNMTISANVALGASQTWLNNSTNGVLTVSGNINNGANTLTASGNGDITISGIIGSGTGGLIKDGTGTLTLSNTNTYTGATTVKYGVLSINATSNLGSATSAVVLGDSTHTGTITYTGATTGFSRGFTVNAGGGEIDVINAASIFTISSPGISTAGVLTLGGSGNFSLSGSITGSGSLIKTGTGTLTLGSTSNSFNGLSLKAGTLKFNNNNVAGSGIITLGDSVGTTPVVIDNIGGTSQNNAQVWNQDFTFIGTNGLTMGTNGVTLTGTRQITTNNSNNDLTVTGNIADAGAGYGITKAGVGRLTLAGTGNYSGTTTLNAGTLVIVNTQALGTGTLQLNGGTLDLATDTSTAARNTVVGGSVVILSDKGTGGGAGITHTLGTLNIGASTLALGVGSNVNGGGTAGLAFGATTLSANGAVFDTAASTNLTLGALSGNFSFTKQNAGQMTLGSASGRTGGAVSLTAGTMILNDPAALGSSGVSLTVGSATLDLAADSSVNAHDVTINGTAIVVSDRKTSGSAITHTLGALNIGANTFSLTSGVNVSSGTGGLTFGATTLTGDAIFDTGNNTKLTLGALSGAFNLTKQGSGQLALGTSSARTGGSATLVSGTLIINNPSALGTAAVSLNLNGGTLDLATDTPVNSHNVTMGGSATILADRLTSGPGITQTLGTLSITSNQTLTVDTSASVSGGSPSLAFGAVAISNSATIITNPSVSTTLSSLALSGGTARLLTLSGSGNTAITGNITQGTGALSILKSGAGTVTFSGNNTFAGNATISGGTLIVNNSGALGVSASAVVINSTGVLAIGSGVTLTRNATFSSSATLAGLGIYNPSAAFSVPNLSPGISSLGTLTVQKGLTVTGTTTIDIGAAGSSDSSPGTSDRTDVTGNLFLSNSAVSLLSAGSGGPGAYRIFTYTGSATASNVSISSNLSNVHYKLNNGGAGIGAGQGIFVDVFRYATVSLPSTVDLGRVHLGGTLALATLPVSNTAAADGFSEYLSASFGAATGGAAGTGSVNILAPSATSSAMSVGFGSTAQNTGGTVSGSINVNLLTDGTGTSGAGTTSIGTQAVAIKGFVYTGQGTWSLNGGGSWNSFGNWASAGGVPGVDGAVLSAGDTATFDSTLTGTGGVVTLDGANPQVSSLVFAGGGSYTIAQGTGGTLTLSKNGGAEVQVNVSGSHTISAPLTFANDVRVTASGAGDSLAISGNISGSGKALTKAGAGLLELSGSNTLGSVAINAGTLRVSSSGALGSTGTISFGGGTLQHTSSNTTDYSGRFSTANNQQFKIDTNGQNVTLASNLSSSGGTIAKIGAGVLTLSGNNTGVTGLTTVSGGTLKVSGSLGTGGATVASGAKIIGTGSIGGITTIQSGGVLNPNDVGTVGTITLDQVVLNSGGKIQMDLSSSTSFDKIVASSVNTSGGTLEVNLVSGATPFHVNDTFQLFSAGGGGPLGLSGSFANVYLPGNYVWDTSNLTTAGTIRVAALPEPGQLVLGGIALVPAALALIKRRKKKPVTASPVA